MALGPYGLPSINLIFRDDLFLRMGTYKTTFYSCKDRV